MPTKRILVLDPMGGNPALSPLKAALAALVSRGDLDEVVDIASLDIPIRSGAPFSALMLVGPAPLALTQGVASAGVAHAIELTPAHCDPLIRTRFSEPAFGLDGQIAAADAIVTASGAAIDLLAAHLGVKAPKRILSLDACLVAAAADPGPINACVLIGAEATATLSLPSGLLDAARKSGIRLHRMTGSAPDALADAASFCTAYPRAALRVLRTQRPSPVVAAGEALEAWTAAYRLMGSAAWDIREVSPADWTDQARGVFAPTPHGRCRFDHGHLLTDLAEWIAAAVATERRISIPELRLLSGLVPRRVFGGALGALRLAPQFVVAPPGAPRPEALAGQEPPATLSLRALATPLPADARGVEWREALASQATEAERFLEERGLARPAEAVALPPPAPETELRATVSNLQAELRSSDALVDGRLAAMRAMEALIRERDATIAWQAKTLDERWESMAAMGTQIEQLRRRGAYDDPLDEPSEEARA